MSKVALIVIYNHQFNENIDVVERIYNERFSHIFHLVPFYSGDQSNVIPVFENSYYFEGYVAQGLKSFYNESFTHYFFIADDLILNPVINENNYTDHLKLKDNSCFFTEFINLHDKNCDWGRIYDGYKYSMNIPGVEVNNQIINYEEALQKFEKMKLNVDSILFENIWKTPHSLRDIIRKLRYDKTYFIRRILNKISKKKFNLSYPMIGGYSDIFLISSDTIKEFCHYCGVFAVTKLFVEIALPTALVLSAKELITEKDIDLAGKAFWPDGWVRLGGNFEKANNDFDELDKFDDNLKDLLNDFPENYLYIHPVKLSKWNTDL